MGSKKVTLSEAAGVAAINAIISHIEKVPYGSTLFIMAHDDTVLGKINFTKVVALPNHGEEPFVPGHIRPFPDLSRYATTSTPLLYYAVESAEATGYATKYSLKDGDGTTVISGTVGSVGSGNSLEIHSTLARIKAGERIAFGNIKFYIALNL